MKEERWRTFGHIVRLLTSAPCQESMNYYFECPPEGKKFRGRKRINLPVLLDSDIIEAAKYHQQSQIRQFKTRENLETLRPFYTAFPTTSKLLSFGKRFRWFTVPNAIF